MTDRVPAPSPSSHWFFLSDGTLVTQRFHFAPMPHQYRHILGWYRLVHELREHGIRAICVFDGEERTLAKSNEVRVSLYGHSCLVDMTQQNRRRHIRRTDALRGEIESDRLKRLLALTKGLDALRLLDKNERLLFIASFRNQMAKLDGHFVPKHYPDQPSLTDHYLQRRFSEVESSLDQRETPWLDEVDLDELYYKNGLSVANDEFTPEETDVMCVGSHVVSRENKHRLLDVAANTALGPENRIFTTSNSYWRPPASINTRADMFWLRLQKWSPQKTTKRVKNGIVWHRPWLIFTRTTVVVWLNWK